MRKMMFVFGVLFLALMSTSICAKPLAKIGSNEISLDEFNQRLQDLPAQYRSFFSTPDGKKKFLEQLVSEQLLWDQAQKDQLDNDPEVKKEMADFKKRVMISALLKKLMANTSVSNAEAEVYYNTHQKEFISAEQVHARHILVRTEAEARSILATAKKGTITFAQLAQERSLDTAAENGDLGWFERGQMVPEFEEAAFALKPGQLSDVVKTKFGYHIIKLEERKASAQKTFSEVKQDIEEKLKSEAQKKKLDDLINELKTKTTVEVDDTQLQ
jgi:peptidyl-prolyl cis-trans isomerase C